MPAEANGGEGADQVVLETANLLDLVWDKILMWIEQFFTLLPNIAVAIVVLVTFAILSRLVRSAVVRAVERAHASEQLATLAGISARLGLLGLGIFLALGVLELQRTAMSLLAGVGVVGLALGFAFQDIASNFMSGVIMAVRRPFAIGDLVETNDVTGHIVSVNLRATVIRTFSGQIVIIPNKDVLQNPIVNFVKEERRRIEIPVGVAYDTDLPQAIEVACDAVSNLSCCDESETVRAVYEEFGDSSIGLEVQFWIDQESSPADYLEARSQGIVAIHQAFDEAGIEIPFPIRTLDVPDASGGEPSESAESEESEESEESDDEDGGESEETD